MDVGSIAWVLGGYLSGTFPSTLLVARSRRATGLIASARRDAGEADAHILMTAHLGVRWTALAAFADVLKAFLFVLAARHWGGLGGGWVAAVGLASVLGHTYPFYARGMAGRGLAASAGVLLVLLPVEMAVAGSLIVVGGGVGLTSSFSTIGMASVPIVAAIRGQSWSLVAMAIGIFAILVARRLEGVGSIVRSGVPLATALYWRIVHDASTAPRRGGGIRSIGLRRSQTGDPGRQAR